MFVVLLCKKNEKSSCNQKIGSGKMNPMRVESGFERF